MRKVIWSPKAIQDYIKIIDYLQVVWTIKEVQHFIDKVMFAMSVLEKGDFKFKRAGIKDYSIIVIQRYTSIIYRIDKMKQVQIIRIWDNRQNPVRLRN